MADTTAPTLFNTGTTTSSAPLRPPYLDVVATALATAQARHHLFPAAADCPYTVVVGVSGGLDSVSLLHALRQVAPMWRLALHIAHLDHGLRAESVHDAAFVADLAHRAGLPFHLHRVDGHTLLTAAEGVEAAARRARYAFLAQVACAVGGESGPAAVAVAHHQDDQAETVLMHLLTGSGLAGLGGMPWVAGLDRAGNPADGPVRLVRPLLGVRRADLAAYAAQHSLIWREDATNHDPVRLRNRLRHAVIPLLESLNPALTGTLARNAEILAAEADRAARTDTSMLADLTCEDRTPDRLVLDLDRLAQAHPATRRGVVRAALARLGADLRAVGAQPIERILDGALHQDGAGGPYPLPGGLAWTLLAHDGRSRRLSLHRTAVPPCAITEPSLPMGVRRAVPSEGALLISPSWQLTGSLHTPAIMPDRATLRAAPWTAYLDADAAGELILTTPAAGMRLAPLGMHGHSRSLGDLFTDRKVPPALRPTWPVLLRAADAEVIWLCGLAISHHARVHTDTRRVLRLVWSQDESAAR